MSGAEAPLNSSECSSHLCCASFAGGKKDPSDRTVVDTALREAREELGIHISEENVWGVLKPLRDTVSVHSLLVSTQYVMGTYFTRVSECRHECESPL